MTVRSGWDDWDPGRDLPALERLMVELIEEQRPVDARLVARAARALAVASSREHAATQRDARGVRSLSSFSDSRAARSA